MTVLAAVTGAAPGVGKSTVCVKLHRWLVNIGLQADLFDVETACAYLERERETTLRLLRSGGWHVIVVDQADRLAPSAVLDGCRDALRPLLMDTQEPAR